MAQKSGFTPFQRLARSFLKHSLTPGLIKGFNNLLSRIIRKACGISDLSYLELKLRHHSVNRS